MKFSNTILLAIFVLVVVILKGVASQEAKHNYADALSKSILFFEGQRSGKLPFTQRMKWRKDSALHDGKDAGMDLTGGYYDAGDNIKFNFPMAFTTTVLSWGVIEYGNLMGSELVHATEAVRWGTDYLLKSTSIPNKVVVQIGDPYSDHTCWQRPEDMDTDRTTFAVTDRNPGSEVAAETAAALASSSIIFQKSDPAYSKLLLQRAIQVFNFADRHRGSFNDSLGHWVCPFYCDFSGYHDELLWAAAWLYKASNQQNYRDYVVKNSNTIYTGQINALSRSGEFGWDDKHAGIYVLMATDFLMRGTGDSQAFQISADDFICTVLPESPTRGVTYSKGGLMFKTGACNMQHTTALSFLLLTYSRYLAHSGKVVRCGDKIATPQRIVEIVKGQVDYILGSNPMKMSYMVGYGNRYPQKIHHRGSVLPSVDQHPQHLACHDETPYFKSTRPNPNQLTGAVVGGPWPNDTYPDSRYLSELSEPTTYVNAPLVGVLAYFSAQTKN